MGKAALWRAKSMPWFFVVRDRSGSLDSGIFCLLAVLKTSRANATFW